MGACSTTTKCNSPGGKLIKQTSSNSNQTIQIEPTTTSNNLSQKNQVNKYGICNHPSKLTSYTEIQQQLIFRLDLKSMEGRQFYGEKHYFVKVVFSSEKENFFTKYSSVEKGPEPSFSFEDESYEFSTFFEEMKKTFVNIYLFEMPKLFEESNYKAYDPSKSGQNLQYTSAIKIDFLTVALGPDQNNFLLKNNKGEEIGRILFVLKCSHLSEVQIRIKNLTCNFDKILLNKITLSSKFYVQNLLYDDWITAPLENLVENKSTIYQWNSIQHCDESQIKEESCEKGACRFLSYKLKAQAKDIMSSNLNIYIYDTMYNLDNAHVKNTQDMGVSNSNKRKRESNTNIASQFHNIPSKGVLRSFNNLLTDDKAIIQAQNIPVKGALRSSNNLVEDKSDVTSIRSIKSSIVKGSEIDFHPTDLKLIPKFKHIGTMNIDFLENFSTLTKLINVQTIKFFENYSIHYKSTNESCDFKLKVFKDLDKKFNGDIYDSDGEIIGEINGVIVVENFPLISQLQHSVHTESGLELLGFSTNTLLKLQSFRKDSMPNSDYHSSEVEDIVLGHSELKSILSNIHEDEISYVEKKTEIIKVILKGVKNLKLYENILKAQLALLNAGILLISNLETFHKHNRNLSYNILEMIFDRDELSLNSLSLNCGLINEDCQLSHSKLQVGILYIELIYSLLTYSLKALSRDFIDNKTKAFISVALALCFVVITDFRYEFLQELKNIKTDEVDRADSIFRDVSTASLIQKHLQDWKFLFFDRILKYSDSFETKTKRVIDAMYEALEAKGWRDKIAKKDRICFSIIKNIFHFSQRKKSPDTGGTDAEYVYTDFPGCNDIIKLITERLKTLDIKDYPIELIEAIKIFTHDIVTLNKFLAIFVGKTNVYDTKAVSKTIDILDSLFECSNQVSQLSHFKYNFDYHLLKKAMSLIIEKDHSFSVCKVLHFYYRNIRNMSLDHIVDFCKTDILNNFFHLFFHWCFQVREAFYYFILFAVLYYLKYKGNNYKHEKENNNASFKKLSSGVINPIEQVFANAKTERSRSFHLSLERTSNKSEIYYTILNSLMKRFEENIKTINSIKNELSPIIEAASGDVMDIYAVDLSGFSFKSRKINQHISEVPMANVLSSIKHYISVEKHYKAWEKEKIKNENHPPPHLEFVYMKDDYIQDLTMDY